MPDSDARALLSKLLRIVQVNSITHEEVESAIDSPLVDFEDAIVVETAIAANADYIITRNVRDFSKSPVVAIHPADFLQSLFL